MGKIIWAPGIEQVSGALTKIKTKSQHADDQNMFLATHRNAATMSKSCSRAFFRKINNLPWQNGAVPSADVLNLRRKFAQSSTAIAERREDLTHFPADNTAFKALNAEYLQKTGLSGTKNVFYWAAAKKYTAEGQFAPTWPQGAIDLTYEEYAAACASARK